MKLSVMCISLYRVPSLANALLVFESRQCLQTHLGDIYSHLRPVVCPIPIKLMLYVHVFIVQKCLVNSFHLYVAGK